MRCDKLIRGGFSFCGVDIASLGLSYAPENENTYVYHPTEVNVNEEIFDGHDGGYFYGVSKQPKEFILRCYFEDEIIDRGIMERIYNLFRTGKSGKLIFSRRPWCYYYATVTSLPHPELSNHMNGFITVTMRAYYPYARRDTLFSAPDDVKHDIAMESTALVESENMVPDTTFSDITSRTPFILHNPGTEYAPVSIMIAGDAGMGVVIRNNTTNQECKIVAMDKTHTSSQQKAVYIDGINGNTTLRNLSDGHDSSSAFIYHDSGFIYLAPAYYCIRNIFIEQSSSNVITLTNTLYEDVEGQYIFINGQWCKITEQIDEQQLRINKSVSVGDTNRTMITKMNELEIIPIDTCDITHLSFFYKPTFA